MGAPETRCYTKHHYENNGKEGEGFISKEENGNILQPLRSKGTAAQKLTKEVIAAHKQELNDDCCLRPMLLLEDCKTCKKLRFSPMAIYSQTGAWQTDSVTLNHAVACSPFLQDAR